MIYYGELGRMIGATVRQQRSKRLGSFLVRSLSHGNGHPEEEKRVDPAAAEPKPTSARLINDQATQDFGLLCSSRTGIARVECKNKSETYLVQRTAYGDGCIMRRLAESFLAMPHPSSLQQLLLWNTAPTTVLLLKKPGASLIEEANKVVFFLNANNIKVLVERGMSTILGDDRLVKELKSNEELSEVDFVVCLGGDGSLLHAASLFQGFVPPVVCFNLGSLGFLTGHPFNEYEDDLSQILRGGVYLSLRMRLRCEILRENGNPSQVYHVLNEVAMDRGPSPFLCNIEVTEGNKLITKVQGDGLIVATPTGSTAYSRAAGGPLVHPTVPAIVVTPVCPHTLSFRPVVLPDSANLELKVPDGARTTSAYVSFDGEHRQAVVNKGDRLLIKASRNPVPIITKSDHSWEWFESLKSCFNWSIRKEQKPLL